ncbi:mitochondrial outer membrane translocase receptor TOM70 [Gloeophyllum trabeum ATCC 11539]|uniref:Mitochondrial outer membrane translocase receptor TOM70 n=1 Tax=Gloeophyllum trabeum (strain ATCC 11539 / FP-39264 / Madison 617) TaxID=670483 RepID=S7RGA8_GLOTA|nr:mitochondrial outer membrane translocase receptor TOM70 [Gloeophyllum trabeum ATCC 11539]EPQ53265.1 mitochondrial outer membrane translocase receptor TOM70 [Gloeophyllum trabeum ATCC 11539]
MSTEGKTKLAATLKSKGNSAYQSRKFAVAADYYTRAIAVSPKPEPVFYSNRAACYVNMSPPKYEQVVADCDEALKLDASYVKALNRRAMALEALDRLEESLRDFTAATILDKFQNESSAQSVERVLKKLSTRKAAEILANREKRLPSHTFVTAYFAAFRPRPLPELPENPSQGDETLIKALQALEAADYPHAMSLTNEALEQGVSFDAGKAEALNLRGTFKFLVGDIQGAKEDLLASVELVPAFTQSLVKLASVYMEQGDPPKAFEAFEEAIKFNPKDPDIFYHRGQVLFIMNEFARAADDYTKSTELDPNFVFSHIQLAVAQYKSGQLSSSMATFRRTLKAFPQRSEPQNYYGELLLDQQRFQDAVEKFDRAIELEKAKPPPMNVLPLVNKGLALYQWKQDIVAAEKCCDEALEIDPECEAAVATLAQLSLQQGKIDRAVQMFERQSELARSEPELANALTYQYASWAQLDFMKNYPQMAESLGQMARNLV